MLAAFFAFLKGRKTIIAAFAVPLIVNALVTLSPDLAAYFGKGGPVVAEAAGLIFGFLRLVTDTPIGQAEIAKAEAALGLNDAQVASLGAALSSAVAQAFPKVELTAGAPLLMESGPGNADIIAAIEKLGVNLLTSLAQPAAPAVIVNAGGAAVAEPVAQP